MGRFIETSRPAHSSNYTAAARTQKDIYLVMLHSTESSAASAASWFANPASDASSHVTITSKGEILHHVHPRHIAWTNGNWDVNRRALSIEFEGYAAKKWEWDNQFEAAAWLIAQWATTYDLSCRLVGNPEAGRIPLTYGIAAHRQVIGSDHTDPGLQFPYKKLSERADDLKRKLKLF